MTHAYTYGCGNAPFLGIEGLTPNDFVDMALLNTNSLNLLNGVCEETGCNVIITSTWRINCSELVYWNSLFHYTLDRIGVNSNIDVIGCTGYNDDNRGEEIQDYLDSVVWSNYVVIDDDNGDISTKHPRNFVHVDGRVGFSFKDYEKALSILKD